MLGSFDDVVGAGDERVRYVETQRFGSLEVDRDEELCRRLHHSPAAANRKAAGATMVGANVSVGCRT